ncbi:CAHS7 [Ramazzottius varieornatus]|uniref:CAHS7 n=1 Tax=Ramazzottius varieornatus TaxID=947166 RepID=A0A1D1UMG9_RAMVA|nr:CAHS7 [Ramazzottius varieornatus]
MPVLPMSEEMSESVTTYNAGDHNGHKPVMAAAAHASSNVKQQQQQQQQAAPAQPQVTAATHKDLIGHRAQTYSSINPPAIHLSPVLVSPGTMGPADEIVGHGLVASAACVSATATPFVFETAEQAEKSLKDREDYLREQEKISLEHEKKLEKLTDSYRKSTEEEAERIRKELEKQHERDVAFRKDVLNSTIDRQQKEVDLQVKYAKKQLEHEREMAIHALEEAKAQAEVHVQMDTAAGTTFSDVNSSASETPQIKEKKSLGSKLKSLL